MIQTGLLKTALLYSILFYVLFDPSISSTRAKSMPPSLIGTLLIFARYDLKIDVPPIKHGYSVMTTSPGSTMTFATRLMACNDPVVMIRPFDSTGNPFLFRYVFTASKRGGEAGGGAELEA